MIQFLKRFADNFSQWDENLGNALYFAITWGEKCCTVTM